MKALFVSILLLSLLTPVTSGAQSCKDGVRIKNGVWVFGCFNPDGAIAYHKWAPRDKETPEQFNGLYQSDAVIERMNTLIAALERCDRDHRKVCESIRLISAGLDEALEIEARLAGRLK